MANLATKAPNFTRENAPDMARRATESRLAREAREKAEDRQRDIEARALAISREIRVDPDDARKMRVQKQIDLLLTDMEATKDADKRLRFGAAIERLWKLVQPTAGVQRPGRTRRESARIEPEPEPSTPQENLREIKVSSENGSNSALPSEPNG